MKNKFFIQTHYRNLIYFYSFGYISPVKYGLSCFKYYHLQNLPLDKTLLYPERPDNISKDTALIEIYLYYKKTDLKKIKTKVTVYQFEKFISLNSIINIHVTSQEIIDSLLQMEFSSNIDFKSDIFKIINIDKVEDDLGIIGSQKISLKDSINKNKITKNNLNEFAVFSRSACCHLLIMNYVIKNNLFSNEICNKLPKSFSKYPLIDEQKYNFIKSLKKVINEIHSSRKPARELIVELKSNMSDDISENELLLWISVYENLFTRETNFKVEELDENYIDNSRQFSFDINTLRSIGKDYKDYIISLLRVEESDHENYVKNDPLISILAQLVNSFDQLELKSTELLSMINESNNNLFIHTALFLHDLSRYGDNVELITKKFNELAVLNKDLDLLSGLLFSLYIGLQNLPKELKQPINSQYLWGTFENEMILSQFNIDKSLKKRIPAAVKRPHFTDYLVEDTLKIHKSRFLVKDKEVEIFPEEGKACVTLTLENNYSFLYTYSEEIPLTETLDIQNVDSFIEWVKQFLSKTEDKSRKIEIMKDIYNNLNDIEKVNYAGFKKKRSSD